MLVRIVKLIIKKENITSFEQNFEENKHRIRNFKGCSLLELYQDRDDPSIFFTYSYWDSEDSLQAYRNSDLFQGIWKKTKLLFAGKPEAWSINKKVSLN
ncbi:putative quinol monooxygenase [Spongiimicrobium salis]|uniref:putative quinol monooxygenase n=1 Tax=Spongiimicrobium salis TaxID=1667022 RepID=UPI00374D56F5